MFLASADVDMRREEWVDPNAGRMLFADCVEEWRTTTVHLLPRRPTATNAIYASTSCPVSDDAPVRHHPSRSAQLAVRAHCRGRRSERGQPPVPGAAHADERRRRERADRPGADQGGQATAHPQAGDALPVRRQQGARAGRGDPPWFRTWVYFAADTGLRWSEMLGLRRKDVDLLRGRVRVEQQIIEVRSKFLGFGPVKTDAGRRTVTMPKFLVEMGWKSS